MSNVNRERKLKPHQRRVWTDAFKASMSHVSIEAAERKAWQAVDICERVGAFHESISSTQEERSTMGDYEIAFKELRNWFAHLPVSIDTKLNIGSIYDALDLFDRGGLEPDEFRKMLRSIHEPLA